MAAPPDPSTRPPEGKPSKAASGRTRRPDPSPMLLMGAGMELTGLVIVLALGGWWLDGKWGTSPWLTVTGAGIGIVGGIYNLYRIGKRFF